MGEDVLAAGVGIDEMHGGLDNDVLFGGNAYGEEGDDILVGINLNDIQHINNGSYKDLVMNGGVGDDSYFFDLTYSGWEDWNVNQNTYPTGVHPYIPTRTTVYDTEGEDTIYIKGLDEEEILEQIGFNGNLTIPNPDPFTFTDLAFGRTRCSWF